MVEHLWEGYVMTGPCSGRLIVNERPYVRLVVEDDFRMFEFRTVAGSSAVPVGASYEVIDHQYLEAGELGRGWYMVP